MKEKPVICAKEAAMMINDSDTVLVSGFMGVGSPLGILEALKNSGKKNLVLVCNDGGLYSDNVEQGTGVAPNIAARQFKKVIASHIGLNKEIQRQMVDGETEVELVPQGTLAERIRAGGTGLGGILTPTGVGTAVEEGKSIIEIEEKQFLLELPIKGNVALIRASKADKAGNLMYPGSARNFGPLMAAAAEKVLVEADEIVEIGEIDPDIVVTPGIFVDYLVQREEA